MKKSAIIFLSLLAVIAAFSGCSKNDKASQSESIKAESAQESECSDIDKTLTGKALLESIKYSAPQGLVMESEIEMTDVGESKVVSYIKGENSRTETSGVNYPHKLILIYNAGEGVTYQYNEGEAEGIVIRDGDDEEDSQGAQMDAPSLSDILEESSDNIVARVEKLDGEDVVYVESSANSDGEGNSKMIMWYSAKYSMPLKYEMHMNGRIVMKSRVTRIEENLKLDDALFEKPDGVEFQEYSVGDIFEGEYEQ